MHKPFTLLLLFLSFYASYSQVSITEEPSWIINEAHDPNAVAPENGLYGGSHVLLYTEQVHVDREEVYVKNVAKAVEYSGVQNISSVVADYDPSYQKLRFHRIDVIRNGETINKLKLQDIQTARRETNAESFIYDGSISAFVNIPDVRMGDIVVYSYSLKGFNPIQKNKFTTSFVLNSTQPIDRISAHVFTQKPLHYKMLNSDLVADLEVRGGINHYKWAQEDVPAILLEEQTPSWYIQNETVLVTEYDSWNQVINWGNTIFTFDEPLNPELQKTISNIESNHKTEGERIKSALAFVQNEVRYLSIASGIGGYKPNSPNKVMEQRFGDCKDKSVLFATMLNQMGIEAYPTLVNTTLKQELPNLTPSSKIFDHCIVKVVDKNGTTLWYDPTLTDQGGTYANTYTPDYRYGLVLDENMSDLDTIADFRSNMIETFSTLTLEKDGMGADLEVRTHYYEGEADFMRSVFRNNSKDLIQQELMSFYTDNYGKVSSLDPPTIEDDTLKNEFLLLERYHLDSIWSPSVEKTNTMNLSIFPNGLISNLSMPTQLERVTPYALSYPFVRKEHIKVKLAEGIRVQPESVTINSDYFYYDFSSKYNAADKIIDLDYYYKHQDDHVPVAGFDTYYNDMVKLDQNLGYLIYTNSNSGVNTSTFSLGYTVGTLIGVGIIIAIPLGLITLIIILVVRYNKKKAANPS
ncbi:DUF3857 domain-containing transglutaminase family protein [Flagellimonas sp. GZD32]|uniref:DUF3857 domain-containing transglutaminase family protein n=1 Tax=Flagellimonas cixiensis TaxID=3228750 RepID=UPI0035C8C6F9